ncbi:MAG: hypothetical protein Q8908_16360, partial [Bacteroidota bacterium]|nr:hypothetical protein [Bacteroidota bacterium]
FAGIYVDTYGWWNCAVDHIAYSIKLFGDAKRTGEFLKLFVKTESMDNLDFDAFYDDVEDGN